MEEVFDLLAVVNVALAVIQTYYYIKALQLNHRNIWINIANIIKAVALGITYFVITITGGIILTLAAVCVRLIITYVLTVGIFESYRAVIHRREDYINDNTNAKSLHS